MTLAQHLERLLACLLAKVRNEKWRALHMAPDELQRNLSLKESHHSRAVLLGSARGKLLL